MGFGVVVSITKALAQSSGKAPRIEAVACQVDGGFRAQPTPCGQQADAASALLRRKLPQPIYAARTIFLPL
jgi:hypothetical protein